MPQIFPPNANAFAKFTIIGGAIFVLLLMIVLAGFARKTNNKVGVPVEQPIPFQHNLHAGQLGIDCRYCHNTVEVSASANIPPSETCLTCHSQIRVGSPRLYPLYESWDQPIVAEVEPTGVPIQWNRVHDLADFVYFNHSIHVNKGVGCAECHGRVDQMNEIWKAEPMTMGWCLECHRAPEKFIRPREEVFNMAYTRPEDQLELGEALVKAYHINTEKLPQCSTCHR